ncbi:hypothetical protein [Neorhizobium galegae]|uniref:hypothetical protein n=1 Tax=Neorhizobium galegae TaxID=399 RepID=UPI002102C42C|nr:hypothetical protein [Neorhizobium galegae]MCQ1839063.1 hypothetical protein [Neorhizobium galegae]
MTPLQTIVTWEALQTKLNTDLWDNLIACSASLPDGGVRLFFEWVLSSDDEPAIGFKALLGDQNRDPDQPRAGLLVIEVIEAWARAAVAAKRWKANTVRSYKRAVIYMFEKLGNREGSNFPKVSRRSFHFELATDTTPHAPLGQFDWPELHGIPEEGRNAVALQLVRHHALQIFEHEERAFLQGQRALRGEPAPEGVAEGTWDAFSTLLELEQRSRRINRRSQFSGIWHRDTATCVKALSAGGKWESLGLTIDPGKRNLLGSTSVGLLLQCYGPSPRATQSVQAIFCCDTGWNKQPIQKLPVVPYAFSTASEVRIGSSALLASFKVRADHFVFADPNNLMAVRGIAAGNLESIWENLIAEEEYAESDEHVTLSKEAPLLDILERYSRIAVAVRGDCPPELTEMFFINISKQNTGVSEACRELLWNMPEGPLGRERVGFSTVRKAFLQVMGRLGRSNDETRIYAGHNGSGVLERNYPSHERENEQSIRFFQGCVEAVALPDGLVVKLNYKKEDIEWFRLLAKASGIESACGLAPEPDEEPLRSDLAFRPTDDNLLDLYLADRALKRKKRTISRGRWEVQGVTLSKQLQAIAEALFRKGLKPLYRKAAQRGRSSLQSGLIVLPPVLET